ncbi:MAG: zinc metallopeptidase [Limnochordia bacterium]|jgi:Zn-dependent membrane protease YugP|nr:zinc metallopeptidase [Limnochordia bacterium]MDD2629842.1 zinc metallopeptidase [Limnochordia bacterium]MDD4517314.1 zinc metallopeptidase [Limnochordia bacterium]
MYILQYYATWIVLLPALVLAMYAQLKVQSTFSRYLRHPAYIGKSGAQVARELLDRNNLSDVRVERTGRTLGDHYDPRVRVLRLSPEVYEGRSIAALGVAAHETGHALQHAANYLPLGLRNSIFPVASFGSQLALPLFFVGLLFQGAGLGWLTDLGILLFMTAILFQLVTLPVEFNASRRAMALLSQGGYITRAEAGKTKEILSAAALTYVAAVAVSIGQLLRLLLIRGQRRD